MKRKIALLLSFLAGCVPCSALTANDIRVSYSYAPITLIEDFEQTQQAMQELQTIQRYNRFVSDMQSMDLTYAQKSLNSLEEQILSGIELSLEEILQLEAQYYTLEKQIQQAPAGVVQPIALDPQEVAALESLYTELSERMENTTHFLSIGSESYYPVEGTPYHINSTFGTRADPFGSEDSDYHVGIDLKAPMGTPIGAWFSGIVASTGFSPEYGYYIRLDHGDGVSSFYCHLDTISVVKGQQVVQGDCIAASGNTGTATTGPHLHLGLYIDGTAVDPQRILG